MEIFTFAPSTAPLYQKYAVLSIHTPFAVLLIPKTDLRAVENP